MGQDTRLFFTKPEMTKELPSSMPTSKSYSLSKTNTTSPYDLLKAEVWNALRDLLLSVQFEAWPWNFTKSNSTPWVFSRFLNCTNDTKLRKHHVCIATNCVISHNLKRSTDSQTGCTCSDISRLKNCGKHNFDSTKLAYVINYG